MALSDKIKVLVLGDSGVGKSSLVHLICHSQPITSPSWTIGCSIDVKLHEYKEGTPAQKTCFIELWDIGGNRSHSIARSVFYNAFHGIILVHDLTNRKSHFNLRNWLGHVFCGKDSPTFKENTTTTTSISAALFPVAGNDNYEFDLESFFEKNIPVLIIGTKAELATASERRSRVSSIAEDCGGEEIHINCNEAKGLAPGSTNAVQLSRFFDKVVERKFHSYQGLNVNVNPSYSHQDNKNKRNVSHMSHKVSHLD